jgi:hypothetical protein
MDNTIEPQKAHGLRRYQEDRNGDNRTCGETSVASAVDLNEEDPEGLHDGDDVETQKIADEDAQNLMSVSISRVATRLMSPTTPAAEKAAAMEELDGGDLFNSDEDVTPPPEPIHTENHFAKSGQAERQQPGTSYKTGLSLGRLPSPKPESPEFPTPWLAAPKTFVVQRPEESRSVLRDAFGVTKRRSFSGGADALRKLLPSMPKAASFIPTMPSASIFSSNGSNKPRNNRGMSLLGDFAPSWSSASNSGQSSPIQDSNNNGKPPSGTISRSNNHPNRGSTNFQLPPLRRVASDDSLLYHTLSRASSLGDDTRFEHHHEMVNSRVKAIRDTLQDRSSFRLPTMSSMPRIPSFSFASFAFNMNANIPVAMWRSNTDLIEDILPGNPKKRLGAAPNPAITPGLVGAAVSRPEAAIDSVQPIAEGPSDSQLERAIANLTGDIVIMGGYRGSILRSAKPPHRQLWVPVKVGLNIRKVNLEVGLDPEDEERMEEHIFASGMLQHIGPVDISRRLFKRLRESENAKLGKLRIWDYGYDWRLSPHLLSKKLIQFLEKLPSNQAGIPSQERGALIIAHSLGGLITRHAVNQRPELFSGVIFAGVPQSCVNILGPIRNGDAVLLSSRVLTAQVNFTLRTTFALLPIEGYCFIGKTTKEEYPVDFFNVDDWIKYRWSPCTDPPLPPKSQPTGGLANILKQRSLTNLQLLPGTKSSNASSRRTSQAQTSSSPSPVTPQYHQRDQSPSLAERGAEMIGDIGGTDRTLAPQIGNQSNPVQRGHSTNSSVSTAVTIPRDKAIAYLKRTLAETKQFKLELAANPSHAASNLYPPFAVIYGKSIPTVYGARVDGRDGIACADSYDDLAFASGDGVCLAREAMLPEGYCVVRGGRISSDRGHVTLLGDLNAVGKAIQAVVRGRRKGMGLGAVEKEEHKHGQAVV